MHVAPLQEMPGGLLVTEPWPAPVVWTVSFGSPLSNVAVTVFAASIVSVQVTAEPEQSPLHFAKDDPAAGVAVSVTWLSVVKFAEQVDPQLIPARASSRRCRRPDRPAEP